MCDCRNLSCESFSTYFRAPAASGGGDASQQLHREGAPAQGHRVSEEDGDRPAAYRGRACHGAAGPGGTSYQGQGLGGSRSGVGGSRSGAGVQGQGLGVQGQGLGVQGQGLGNQKLEVGGLKGQGSLRFKSQGFRFKGHRSLGLKGSISKTSWALNIEV